MTIVDCLKSVFAGLVNIDAWWSIVAFTAIIILLCSWICLPMAIWGIKTVLRDIKEANKRQEALMKDIKLAMGEFEVHMRKGENT